MSLSTLKRIQLYPPTLVLSLLPFPKAGLRMLWALTIAGMVAWALAFPSWFGLVLLAWAGIGICMPRPSQFFLTSLPLLPAYTATVLVINVIGALPVDTIPRTVCICTARICSS